MKKRHLYPAVILGTLGLVPSFAACSSTSEGRARTSNRAEGSCITFAETGKSVCDSDKGLFKTTFERFGLAAIGYPLTDVYPDGQGDWYQTFERVDMNGNKGQGCEEGRACIAHLGRWDLTTNKQWAIGDTQVDDCQSDAVGPRINEICLPKDFIEDSYYKNGGLEFYGRMLTRVYSNCPLYPNGIIGECFWTERAKVGRIQGQTYWEGEQLGRKKLGTEGSVGGGPPPIDLPIPSDPRLNLPPTTIYLPYSTGVITYAAGAGVARVCRETADPALVAQLEKFSPGSEYQHISPPVILQTGPESWETRTATGVNKFELINECPNKDGFNVYLQGETVDWMGDFDLAGAFIKQFSGQKFSCQSALTIDEFALDVKRFPIENGVLKKPSLMVTIGGTPLAESDFINCEVKVESPDLFWQAGIIPVWYKLYLSLGFTMKLTTNSRFQVRLGTEQDPHIWLEKDPAGGAELVFTPQIRLGATFYRKASAYVGLNFPITATSSDNCMQFKVGGEMVAGTQLDIPFGTAIQAEWTSEPFFEKALPNKRCQ